MKTTDLMIDDWIDNNLEGEAHYIQISSISDDGKICYKIDETYRDLWLNDNVKAIPITTEILDKNGFYGNGNDVRIFRKNDFDITVVWLKDGLIDINIYGEIDVELHLSIRYIHQLQHILRLVGYNKDIIV